jgi:hypothetical protein
MLGTIRSIMGVEEKNISCAYIDLAADFEKTIATDFPSRKTAARTIETAKRIRNLLAGSELQLEREEKLRLLKMLNKAKVRALLANQDYTFDIFTNLDSISADVARRI